MYEAKVHTPTKEEEKKQEALISSGVYCAYPVFFFNWAFLFDSPITVSACSSYMKGGMTLQSSISFFVKIILSLLPVASPYHILSVFSLLPQLLISALSSSILTPP